MIIRLTHNQAAAVFARIPEDIAEVMREHRTTYGVTQHDYLLPAIGWRRVLDAMLKACLGPAGGKLKTKGRPADSAYIAIRRIAEGVKRIEAHPALRGAAAQGVIPDVVPCWVGTAADRVPYPQPRSLAYRFELLVPEHFIASKHPRTTTWRPASSTELELLQPQSLAYQEGFHLLLVGEV